MAKFGEYSLLCIAYSLNILRWINVIAQIPSFDVPIVNVTVVAGQTAVLPCSIKNLGRHKVAWVDSFSNTLTFEHKRVTDDFRFSVVQNSVGEWNLQILGVREDDWGQYRCTLNTDDVKKKIVTLYVRVPASIDDEHSSSDVTVKEGDYLRLVCNVTGVPRPEVSWERSSGDPDNSFYADPRCNAHSPVELGHGVSMVGEVVVIENILRSCDGYYECIANNGVPPAATKRIRVTVEYPPVVRVLNNRISQEIGKYTILQCDIEAFPHAYNVWQKDGVDLSTSEKHQIEAYKESKGQLTLALTIRNIKQSDYGRYKCTARNAHGISEAVTFLDKSVPRTTEAPRHTTVVFRSISPGSLRKHPNYTTVTGGPGQLPKVDNGGIIISAPSRANGVEPIQVTRLCCTWWLAILLGFFCFRRT